MEKPKIIYIPRSEVLKKVCRIRTRNNPAADALKRLCIMLLTREEDEEND